LAYLFAWVMWLNAAREVQVTLPPGANATTLAVGGTCSWFAQPLLQYPVGVPVAESNSVSTTAGVQVTSATLSVGKAYFRNAALPQQHTLALFLTAFVSGLMLFGTVASAVYALRRWSRLESAMEWQRKDAASREGPAATKQQRLQPGQRDGGPTSVAPGPAQSPPGRRRGSKAVVDDADSDPANWSDEQVVERLRLATGCDECFAFLFVACSVVGLGGALMALLWSASIPGMWSAAHINFGSFATFALGLWGGVGPTAAALPALAGTDLCVRCVLWLIGKMASKACVTVCAA
jgi:hypothetical protein